MALGVEVGLGPHCVRWTPISHPPKGGTTSNFRLISIVGQAAGWIKMPLGMEVGLGPGDLLDGDPAFPLNGPQPPVCGPRLSWPNCWMDEGAT